MRIPFQNELTILLSDPRPAVLKSWIQVLKSWIRSNKIRSRNTVRRQEGLGLFKQVSSALLFSILPKIPFFILRVQLHPLIPQTNPALMAYW